MSVEALEISFEALKMSFEAGLAGYEFFFPDLV